MTDKELAKLIEAEEKRLGLHSPEFMRRHIEIMRTADQLHSAEVCIKTDTVMNCGKRAAV